MQCTHWNSGTSTSKSTASTPTRSSCSSTIDARSWSVASSMAVRAGVLGISLPLAFQLASVGGAAKPCSLALLAGDGECRPAAMSAYAGCAVNTCLTLIYASLTGTTRASLYRVGRIRRRHCNVLGAVCTSIFSARGRCCGHIGSVRRSLVVRHQTRV